MFKRGPKKQSLFDNISVSHSLIKITEIKPLNRPKDWPKWNKKLQGTLGLAGLEKVLTAESAKLTNQNIDILKIWNKNQEKLKSLLVMICEPIALSQIEKNAIKNATK